MCLTGKVLPPQIFSVAPSCFTLATLTSLGESLMSNVTMSSGADNGVMEISLVPPFDK